MKILILSDYFSSKNWGGAGIVSFDEAKILQKRGHEITVITSTSDRKEQGESREHGFKIFRLYSDYPLEWRAYKSLYNRSIVGEIKRIMNAIKPDIVQAYNIHTHLSYYSLKLAKQSGAKVFLTMHDVMAVHYGKFTEFIDQNDLSIPKRFNYKISGWQLLRIFKWQYNPLRNLIIRHYLRYVDKIFAVSDALKLVLNQNGIDNVTVIHNGIDISSWKISDEHVSALKQKYNLLNKKVILFSGWITGAKGGEQLLVAMKKVVEKVQDAAIMAAGRTDLYYRYMQKNASDAGIADRIIFPGWLIGPDLVASYESADVIVFPSICFDTFGMVNLEGMLSKKPVVATCFGGASEVVLDGITGYIVNPYDTDTMAERIIELLLNIEKARQFGQAGYERALKYFNKEDKVDELLKYYS